MNEIEEFDNLKKLNDYYYILLTDLQDKKLSMSRMTFVRIEKRIRQRWDMAYKCYSYNAKYYYKIRKYEKRIIDRKVFLNEYKNKLKIIAKK